MKVNVEKLQELRRRLQNMTQHELEHWKFSELFEINACGSVGCALGWAFSWGVLDMPRSVDLELKLGEHDPHYLDLLVEVEEGLVGPLWQTARKQLGLSGFEQAALFCPAYYQAETPSPDVVAERIRVFLLNDKRGF